MASMWSSALFIAAFAGKALAAFDLDGATSAVGICYSVWHSLGYDGSQPPDITEILIGNPDVAFGPQGAWHYWGRPEGGYYAGSDRAVLDRHFSQISGAGIDFIVIDATNLVVRELITYSQSTLSQLPSIDRSKCRAMENMHLASSPSHPMFFWTRCSSAAPPAKQRRSIVEKLPSGLLTNTPISPHVVFWVKTGASDPDPAAVGRFVLHRYHNNPTFSDLWVTFEGKPLLLTTDTLPGELESSFTLRKMWGLQSSLQDREWSFLQDPPQNIASSPGGGQPEQVSVSAAKQADYMTNFATATPRRQGETFQTQWRRAFEVRPWVVMLTWWNEWIAQRQADDANGNPQFVDNYDSGT
jgi:hypothetical protein